MQYCQSLDLLCGQAVCFLCLCNIRGILCSHHAYGNVEHICNTVLETADYEGHDREEDRPDLTDDIRSCRCHQDRNTYQNVTQDTGGNSFQRRNAYLADCHFDGISPQQSAGVVQISGKVDQGINDQRADKARFLGKTAVVIGGKMAMSKAKEKLLEGVKDSDVQILDFIWYGGDSTYENGNVLMEQDVVRQADMIFAVGGGRACDTGKYLANELDKPLFCFPTVASNCAAVTAISVIYHPDGSFREYYYPKAADHTFIESYSPVD